MNDMSWTKKNVQGEPLIEIKMIIIIKWMAPHTYTYFIIIIIADDE